MKRFAWMIAAAAVAGCGSSSSGPQGTLTMYWAFSDGLGRTIGTQTTGGSGCDAAGVDSVSVVLNGANQGNFPCHDSSDTPGVQFLLSPGAYTVVLNARRSGETMYTTSFSTSVANATDTEELPVLAAVQPSTLDVFYSIDGGACSAANTNISFILYDTVRELDSGTVACGSFGYDLAFPSLPFGGYWIDIQEETPGLATLAAKCGVPLDHEGPPVDVSLIPTSTPCF